MSDFPPVTTLRLSCPLSSSSITMCRPVPPLAFLAVGSADTTDTMAPRIGLEESACAAFSITDLQNQNTQSCNLMPVIPVGQFNTTTVNEMLLLKKAELLDEGVFLLWISVIMSKRSLSV